MQDVYFGRIENLAVRAGQPVCKTRPRMIYEYKFGSGKKPRRKHAKEEYSLKKQVVELFHEFEELGNGTVDTLIIQEGLPFHMSARDCAA